MNLNAPRNPGLAEEKGRKTALKIGAGPTEKAEKILKVHPNKIPTELKNQKPTFKKIAQMTEMKGVTNQLATDLLKMLTKGNSARRDREKRIKSEVTPAVRDPLNGAPGKGAAQTRGADKTQSIQETEPEEEGLEMKGAFHKRGTKSIGMIQRVQEATIPTPVEGPKTTKVYLQKKKGNTAIVQTVPLHSTLNPTGQGTRADLVTGHKIGTESEAESLKVIPIIQNAMTQGQGLMKGPNAADTTHLTIPPTVPPENSSQSRKERVRL